MMLTDVGIGSIESSLREKDPLLGAAYPLPVGISIVSANNMPEGFTTSTFPEGSGFKWN